ncbi:MAG TPA: lysylphosphatidylglycerol synthase domain-containing protein [Gemmatimonadota bacterium]|nr:lysylphosphatidylglycerol synthase domain-containing protein [Gemmatimonadota bacterium]
MPSPDPQVPGSARRRWLRWFELGVAVLVLGFLAAYLGRNWAEVRGHDWSIDWIRLLLASAGTGLAYSGFVILWRRLLAVLGGALTLADAHRIWYLANLGRFVPGKVVQLAGTAYLGRAKGVSPTVSLAAMITAQIFVLGAGLVVAALALPAAVEVNGRLRLAAVLAAALFLAVLLTPLFGPPYRLALRALRRGTDWAPIAWRERLGLTLGYVATWIVLGASFHLFLTAVTEVPRGSLWPVTGIFATAYLAGFLAVFVPGGLGVREGALAVLLAAYIPPTIAVAIAFLARIWSTAVELVIAALLVGRYGLTDLRAGAESGLRDTETRTIHG